MNYLKSLKLALEKLINEKNAILIGEDIVDPYGGAFKVTKGLSEKYPNNLVPTPMSEQGFTAMSIGMALMGEYVIEEIMFGDFITLAADQLINHGAKFHELYGSELHLVVRTPSGGYRGYGATHSQSLEKIFLGIPGLNVVSANRYIDVGLLLEKTLLDGIPSLFIENKLDYSKELILSNFDFFEYELSDGIVRLSVVDETPQFTVVAYGGVSDFAVDCARKLMIDEEIAIDVVIISNLSNRLTKKTVELLFRTNRIVCVEEGTGGFGFACQLSSDLSSYGKSCEVLTSLNSFIPSGKVAENEVLIDELSIYNKLLGAVKG